MRSLTDSREEFPISEDIAIMLDPAHPVGRTELTRPRDDRTVGFRPPFASGVADSSREFMVDPSR